MAALKNTLHLIEEDLKHEDWAIFFVCQLEDYMEKWAKFVELHGE